MIFHHGVASCAAAWDGWTPALVGRYRLVRFDLRGHGASPLPPGFEWSLDATVDDLGAVADAAGADRFHLIGESLGGTVALAFTSRHPERVLSLTVSNGTHLGGAIENLEPWERLIREKGMATWSAHLMKERFFEGALTPEMARWYEAQQTSAEPGRGPRRSGHAGRHRPHPRACPRHLPGPAAPPGLELVHPRRGHGRSPARATGRPPPGVRPRPPRPPVLARSGVLGRRCPLPRPPHLESHPLTTRHRALTRAPFRPSMPLAWTSTRRAIHWPSQLTHGSGLGLREFRNRAASRERGHLARADFGRFPATHAGRVPALPAGP